jgi:BirA family biotin operon repressor/biotin-[acetyl-CoA-carboxylase] ligase
MLLKDESCQLQALVERKLGETLTHLQVLSCCESTNQLCLQQAAHKTVVIAHEQTAGRGRRGNHWHSPAGQNIYCSIGIKKTLPAQYLGLISLLVGVSIANVLRQQGFAEVELKWPNDIVVGVRKLGGILIESRPLLSDEFFLVIGFGLNIMLDENELAVIEQPAISLQQLAQKTPARYPLMSALIAGILRDIMLFNVADIEPMLQQFARLDSFHQCEVEVKTRNGSVFGRYLGVHGSGQLQVETEQGVELFSAAEISLRVAPER